MNTGGGPAEPGIDYTMILTKNDELVIPVARAARWTARTTSSSRTSARLDQSEHLSIIFDPTTAYDILNALMPGEDAEVPCTACCPASAPPATPAT